MIYRYRARVISVIMTSLVFCSYLTSTLSASSSPTNGDVVDNLQIAKVIPFYNASLSSIVVEPLSERVYVSVTPDYPTTSCLRQIADSSNISSSGFPCSSIYILDGNTDQIDGVTKLRNGELIHDIDINPYSGKIYAAGEYNYYLKNETEIYGEEPVRYEDDVLYIINEKNYSNARYSDTNGAHMSGYIQRIKLYGEAEEGKEGDMSSIALATRTNKIYAGIRYFEGGRAGVFVIDDDNDTDTPRRAIEFIPIGETGPDQIIVNNKTNTIYASLEHDNLISLINGSNNIVKERIILQNPRAMSINPNKGLLYVASGDSFWFNVISMNTGKVVSCNTQIKYPVASVASQAVKTGRIYVADCLQCGYYDFTNGTSIHELEDNGSTLYWKTYSDIDINENGLAINPFTSKLYAIGNVIQPRVSNLYVIDLSM